MVKIKCKHNWHFIKSIIVREVSFTMHLAGGREKLIDKIEYAVFICDACGLKKHVKTKSDEAMTDDGY